MTNSPAEKTIRAAIFSQVENADAAVQKLLDAGFSKDEITVICSNEVKQEHFSKFEQEEGLEETDVSGPVQGGAIGTALGGLVSLAGVVATGGVGIAAIGPLIAGGVAGSLVGLLAGKGIENELVRFYDQAVTAGRILVAVHDESDQGAERLAKAEKLFEEVGADPIELEE